MTDLLLDLIQKTNTGNNRILPTTSSDQVLGLYDTIYTFFSPKNVIDISIPSSGGIIVAPETGILQLRGTTKTSGTQIYIRLVNNNFVSTKVTNITTVLDVHVPVIKDNIVTVEYSTNTTVLHGLKLILF